MASDTESRLSRLEATVEEFVSQTARLLGDHGSRLSRNEAQLETLTALFQAADRRLNRLEEAVAANTEAIRYLQEITRTNSENIQGLVTIVSTNEQRFAQLSLSQERLIQSQQQVLSRMDDVIAVMRERL